MGEEYDNVFTLNASWRRFATKQVFTKSNQKVTVAGFTLFGILSPFIEGYVVGH